MAVQATPYVETALSHSAELFRRTLQSGLPFGSAGGVVPATPAASANITAGIAGCSDLQITAPASGMSVNISAGQVIVPGSLGSGSGYGIGKGYGYPVVTTNGGSVPTIASNAHATQIQLTTQGAYYCYSDNSSGAVNLAISAANASNPRIDVVGAQVEDSAYSGSNNDWKLTVITGTAAASPTIPSFPASFVPLALVWVPAASTNVVNGNILDLRVAYNRDPFNVSMSLTNPQSVANGAQSTVNFDTVISDVTAGWNAGGSHWVAPVSGVWVLSGESSWTNNNTGVRGQVPIYSSSPDTATFQWAGPELGSGRTGGGTWMFRLAQGQNAALQVFQTSGGALNLTYATMRIQLLSVI